MRCKLMAAAALILLMACDEEDPGPTVMTLTSETSVIEIAANQLSGLAIASDGDSGASLNFRMDTEIAQAFSEMTAANIGKPISIAVCGEVVSEPRVMAQIDGGVGQISGDSVAELEAHLAKLNGDVACP